MILNCDSCGKKFVVPDNAITASGRMVQCGSCGNKWKQFPIGKTTKTSSITSPQKIVEKNKSPKPKMQKPKKIKKNIIKKSREISLYSPEYLAKKHGIKINETKIQKTPVKNKQNKISFGFYNSLILFTVLIIAFSRMLFFFQETIISIFPGLEFYINYLFESVRNIFEIWKDLITSY